MAQGENLLRETRGTKLYYLPGAIVLIIIFAFLVYADAAAFSSLPGIPYLTDFLGSANGLFGDHYFFYALLVLLLIGFLFLMYRYLRWISRVYAVTNRRVIVQSGIFSKDFDEIPVLQVRGVDVHQTLFQRILGYGTVRVSAEAGHGTSIGNEDWKGIPKPFDFQKHIEEANQALLTQGPRV